MKYLLVFLLLAQVSFAQKGKTYYVSNSDGIDSNNGLSPQKAIKTILAANKLILIPGDSLLFKSGDRFLGPLEIIDKNGSSTQPITISQYGKGTKPIIEGNGFLSALLIENASNIVVSNIELNNDGGPSQLGVSENLRYGLRIKNTSKDNRIIENLSLSNITIRNIYTSTQITDDDQTGVNAFGVSTSSPLWNDPNPIKFKNIVFDKCFFTRTGRHALVVKAIQNLKITNSLFEHVGGAGMVIGANCSDVLIEGNVTNYTGSNIDSRMAARGSGLWCYRTKNVIAQHNKFMHARGVKDSHGMHVDIGNRNLVYQYNYCEDNEGGFVEILGDNINVGYRFNLSVGDGWRKREPQLGRIFWIGGWSGDPKKRMASDSVFIYNNSVYVPETYKPRIWFEGVTKNTRIYNNIVYAPRGFETVFIKNDPRLNDFDNNIWFGKIPDLDSDGENYRGTKDLKLDPQFLDQKASDPRSFLLLKSSPAMGTGKQLKIESTKNYFDSIGDSDFYGNTVVGNSSLNIGAYNGEGVKTTLSSNSKYVELGQDISLTIPKHFYGKELKMIVCDLNRRSILEKTFTSSDQFEFNSILLGVGCYFIEMTDLKRTERVKVYVYKTN